jgi:group I intron endonuclease
MITYKATNTLNGKFYIGSTINFEVRKKSHLKDKSKYPFQNALRLNPEAFEWEIVEDQSDGRELEQALLDTWFGTEMCYNLNPRADSPPVLIGHTHNNGRLLTEEHKEKISAGLTGRPVSEKTRELHSNRQKGELNHNFGKVTPDEVKQKISNSMRGKTRTEEHCSNISASKLGSLNGMSGRRWWNNGTEEKTFKLSPNSPEWTLGRLRKK